MVLSHTGQDRLALEIDGSRERAPVSPMLITSSDSVSFFRAEHYYAVPRNGSGNPPPTPSSDKNNDYRFYLVLFLTLSYFFIEIVIGIKFHSLSLVADAMHMLSDVVAMCIGLYAMRLSRMHASEYSTFGWTRCEIVGGLVNSTFMLSFCLAIIIDATQKIIEHDIDEAMNIDFVLWTSIGGLILNFVGFLILGSGKHTSTNESGEKQTVNAMQNKNMQGVLLHVAADGLGSVSVIAACLFIKFTVFPWRYIADPIFSVVIVLLLAIATVPIMRDAIAILLQQTPRHIDVNCVVSRLLSWDDVIGIHHFHVWTLTSDKIIASMHVSLSADADIALILNRFTTFLKASGISSVTIHPEKLGRDLDDCRKAA